MNPNETLFDYDDYALLVGNTIKAASFIEDKGAENIQTYCDQTGSSGFYGNGSANCRIAVFTDASDLSV